MQNCIFNHRCWLCGVLGFVKIVVSIQRDQHTDTQDDCSHHPITLTVTSDLDFWRRMASTLAWELPAAAATLSGSSTGDLMIYL